MRDRWECKRQTRKLRKLLPKPGRKPVMICSETGRFYKSALLRCDSTSHSDEKLYTARQLPQAPHLCFSYLQLPSDVYFRKTYHNSFLFQPQESIISSLLHFKNMIKAENHLFYMIIYVIFPFVNSTKFLKINFFVKFQDITSSSLPSG